jgi:hypothetical protein
MFSKFSVTVGVISSSIFAHKLFKPHFNDQRKSLTKDKNGGLTLYTPIVNIILLEKDNSGFAKQGKLGLISQ